MAVFFAACSAALLLLVTGCGGSDASNGGSSATTQTPATSTTDSNRTPERKLETGTPTTEKPVHPDGDGSSQGGERMSKGGQTSATAPEKPATGEVSQDDHRVSSSKTTGKAPQDGSHSGTQSESSAGSQGSDDH